MISLISNFIWESISNSQPYLQATHMSGDAKGRTKYGREQKNHPSCRNMSAKEACYHWIRERIVCQVFFCHSTQHLLAPGSNLKRRLVPFIILFRFRTNQFHSALLMNRHFIVFYLFILIYFLCDTVELNERVRKEWQIWVDIWNLKLAATFRDLYDWILTNPWGWNLSIKILLTTPCLAFPLGIFKFEV